MEPFASSEHLSPDNTRLDKPFLDEDEEYDHDPLRRPSMSRNASSRGSDSLYADAGLASPAQELFHSPYDSPGISEGEQEDQFKRISVVPSMTQLRTAEEDDEQYGSFLSKANQQLNRKLTRKLTKTHGRQAIKDPFIAGGSSGAEALSPVTERDETALRPPIRPFGSNFAANRASTASFDSINSIMEEHGAESPLNQAIEGFTDEKGQVTQEFIAKLDKLSASNSKGDLCIAEYLVAAEKAHFKHVRDDKLASARSKRDGNSSSFFKPHSSTRLSRVGSDSSFQATTDPNDDSPDGSQHALHRPAGLGWWQIRLQTVYFGWPLYAILLAAGQVLGATSFQLSLLGGTSSQRNFDLYIIGGVNIIGSVCWYVLNAIKPATWSLSLPWLCFGMAFVLVGLPSLSETLKQYAIRHPLALIASSFYSFASAAGFLFFSTNFGEEAGGSSDTWVFRACVVQGTQQVWVAALWYWGFKLQGTDPSDTKSVPSAWINIVTMTLGALCFLTAYVLFVGLPNYYRQDPGRVPNFVKTLFRRKLVLWYLAAEVLRNYWLSGPYGRNWSFLWTAQSLPIWVTVVLVLIFFVGIWGAVMWFLSQSSKRHTWLLPIFAVGLGAPRWCQMLWGTSSVALYIPWAGRAGPYLATSLWLWLGVLDAIQGVGLGMILLQTLSRVHVAATLCLAQIIGSTAVIVARATAPNRIGPGNVFPDLGLYDTNAPIKDSPLANWEFWVALFSQLIIVAGYLVLFRREQLSKP